MDDEIKKNTSGVQADNQSIAIGGITVGGDVSGNIHIGNTGYTSEEVAVLITQIKSTFQPKPFDGRCPYKGLDVFEEDDAELFFGREKLVDDLVSRVKESRTVFITGPSGSGKSSLVRAGLIHALKRGDIKGSERWLYGTMKPGRDPLEALATVFSRLKSPELGKYFREHAHEPVTLNECAESVLSERKDQQLVLFIDQFEEVFTQIDKEPERTAILALLTHAATVENGRVILLFSMRSDFVSNCATYPQLNALLNQQFIQIGAMQPDELVSAIAQPALRAGLGIDPDLIAQIINDMKGEPGALPLMQFALKDLFDAEQAKGNLVALTRAAYLERGGIHKSLERHADSVFATLSADEQELARSIFSGLIEIGRGTQDTKRTALFDELVPANTNDETIKAIVQKLADARLITTDETAGKDTVTISHEKLIDAWPWLRKLVNENRDVIALQNQIVADAKEWEEHKRDVSYLYSGGRLSNVREQVEKQKLTFNQLAQEFIRTAKARQRRMQAFLISVVSLVVIASIIASVIFQDQAQKYAEAASYASTQQVIAQTNAEEAQKQTRIAQASELAAQSAATRNENFSLSLLLGIESFKKANIIQSQSVLLQNTQTNIQLVSYFYGHSSAVNSLALNQDNSILASGGCTKYNDIYKNCERGEVILWNLESKAPIRSLSTALDGDVTSLAFSPRDTLLASGSCEKAGTQSSSCKDGEIILWDQSNFKINKEIVLPDSGLVKQIRFSSSGKYLISVSEDDIIRVWNVDDGAEVSSIKPGKYIESAIFSLDEKFVIIATVDNIQVYEITTNKAGEAIYFNPSDYRFNTATFSEDGSLLAIAYSPFNGAGSIGWVYFWDLNKKEQIGTTIEVSGFIDNMAFSPDKTRFAATINNKIISWGLGTSEVINTLNGSTNRILTLSFSKDSKYIITGGCNQTGGGGFDGCSKGEIAWWDISKATSGKAVGEPAYNNLYDRYFFNPDKKIFALAKCSKYIPIPDYDTEKCNQYQVAIYNTETHAPMGKPLVINNFFLTSIAFNPARNVIATENCRVFSNDSLSCIDREIILWNFENGDKIELADGGEELAFNSDGTLLAAKNANILKYWDLSTEKVVIQFPVDFSSSSEMFDQHENGTIFDIDDQHNNNLVIHYYQNQPVEITLTSNIGLFALNPNGNTLLSMGKEITLWRLSNHSQILTIPIPSPLFSHVQELALSPDNKTIAALVCESYDITEFFSCINMKILIWGLESNTLIGQLALSNEYVMVPLSFSSDGKILVHGRTIWEFTPQAWIDQTCARVGRNFTRAEWRNYFPNEIYRKTCEQWPQEPDGIATPTTQP